MNQPLTTQAPPILMRFRGLSGAVAVSEDLNELERALERVFVGWPMDAVGGRPNSGILISASGVPDEVRLKCAHWPEDRIEPSIASAISTIAVEMVADFVAAAPGLGSLHAAAVAINGKLVVFPATNRAGKSTLVSALSALGYRVFADDLLPVDLASGEGYASGCLPRPRLPLPAGAPAALKAHLRDNTVIGDGYFAYIDHGCETPVRHGERLPIGAIVLLDRGEEGVETTLSAATRDEALFQLLRQETRRHAPAGTAFADYRAIADGVALYRLSYNDIAAAIETIVAITDTQDAGDHSKSTAENAVLTPADSVQDSAAEAFVPVAKAGDGVTYVPREGISFHIVDQSAFLIDAATNEIHHLNVVGRAVWLLLDGETDADILLSYLAEAFPETPRETIRDDIDRLLQSFRDKDLIRPLG